MKKDLLSYLEELAPDKIDSVIAQFASIFFSEAAINNLGVKTLVLLASSKAEATNPSLRPLTSELFQEIVSVNELSQQAQDALALLANSETPLTLSDSILTEIQEALGEDSITIDANTQMASLNWKYISFFNEDTKAQLTDYTHQLLGSEEKLIFSYIWKNPGVSIDSDVLNYLRNLRGVETVSLVEVMKVLRSIRHQLGFDPFKMAARKIYMNLQLSTITEEEFEQEEAQNILEPPATDQTPHAKTAPKVSRPKVGSDASNDGKKRHKSQEKYPQYHPLEEKALLSKDVTKALRQIARTQSSHYRRIANHLANRSNLNKAITFYTLNRLMPGYSRDMVFHVLSTLNHLLAEYTGRSDVFIKGTSSQYTNGFALVDESSQNFKIDSVFDRVNASLKLELIEASEIDTNWSWLPLGEIAFAFPSFDFDNFTVPNAAIAAEVLPPDTASDEESTAFYPMLLGGTQLAVLYSLVINQGYVDNTTLRQLGEDYANLSVHITQLRSYLDPLYGENSLDSIMGRGFTLKGEEMPRLKFVKKSFDALPDEVAQSIYERATPLSTPHGDTAYVLCVNYSEIAEEFGIEWPFVTYNYLPYLLMIGFKEKVMVLEISKSEAGMIESFTDTIEFMPPRTGGVGKNIRKYFSWLMDKVANAGYQVYPDTGLITDQKSVILPLPN